MLPVGLILAGGQGRRVHGADKGLLLWQGRPMVAWMSDLLQPFCGMCLISCRRESRPAYAAYADLLVHDATPDFPGPLAGLLAALPYCQHAECLILPCDMPLLPPASLQKLIDAARCAPPEIPAFMLEHQGQAQPLLALLRPPAMQAIPTALSTGERSLRRFLCAQGTQRISCELPGFDNLNHDQ